MKTKLFITGLVFVALTTIATAQNSTAPAVKQPGSGHGTSWIDSNNNGVCDNYENNSIMANRGNRNGSCIMQNAGKGQGLGRGKTMNSKGNCPNRAGADKRNFVDANKNGICDNRESAAVK